MTYNVFSGTLNPAHSRWHGYLSGVRCKWFAYGSADATATHSSLASLESRMALPFWCRLTQDVLVFVRLLTDRRQKVTNREAGVDCYFCILTAISCCVFCINQWALLLRLFSACLTGCLFCSHCSLASSPRRELLRRIGWGFLRLDGKSCRLNSTVNTPKDGQHSDPVICGTSSCLNPPANCWQTGRQLCADSYLTPSIPHCKMFSWRRSKRRDS